MQIGERIQEEMKRRKMSQNKLAKLAQISQSGLSSIINGVSSPKENTLQAIASALGITVSDLLEGEKKEAPKKGLDDTLIDMLVSLSPDQVQRVQDFVAGIKAAHKE